MGTQKRNAPTWQGRGAGGVHGDANASILLDRLDGVQPSGNGWRARCPSCGGRSRKLSIAETGGKVLVHCFAGCRAEDVLAAVGLAFRDLFPPRHWPDSPEERRQQRRAIQQAGWAAALATLATEATIVRMAAAQVARWQPLSEEDDARLALAVERIDKAAAVLVEAGR